MRCTGGLCFSFQHLWCGQYEFEFPVNLKQNSIVSVSGQKTI